MVRVAHKYMPDHVSEEELKADVRSARTYARLPGYGLTGTNR